jgi:hypothetical protein
VKQWSYHERDAGADQGTRLRWLMEELRSSPDPVILPFLGRLRSRRDDIAKALDGRSLRAEIILLGERRHTYRIVFTPAGHVELTGPYGFDPHLRFEGTPDRLVGLVLGTLDTFTAVYDQVLTLYFPPAELLHYPGIRRLLADELSDCAAAKGTPGVVPAG